MKNVIIKAYGWFELANADCFAGCLDALHIICREWYLEDDIFSLEDNILQITHEGEYFPHEEVAAILAKYISQESKGKLDIIDLEAWTLLRFFLDAEHNSKLLSHEPTNEITNTLAGKITDSKELVPYSRKSSLNHAIEASQEKNGNIFMA